MTRRRVGSAYPLTGAAIRHMSGVRRGEIQAVMASAALIVIDMLNPYDHPDADELAVNVEGIVDPLAKLIEGALESDVELIYVNDNYGDFAASRDDIVRRALEGRHPELVEPLLPPDGCAGCCRRCATAPSTARRWPTCWASATSRR